MNLISPKVLLVFVLMAFTGSVRAQDAPGQENPVEVQGENDEGRRTPISLEIEERVSQAQQAILAMDLETAFRLLDESVVSADEMALVEWTREHAALLSLLVADEESDYNAFLERNERLFGRIGDQPESAWRLWLMGEVALQRMWARSKRGDSFKAALSARRALRHLNRARELDPTFVEPMKGIGLLHMGIGALPTRYRRVLRLFGISGELEQGLSELAQAMERSVWNRVESAVLLATIDKFGFPSQVKAVEVYEALWQEYPGSPLIGLSYADALIRDRKPLEALDIISRSEDPSQSVHYLTWYRGEIMFRLGRCDEAVAAFSEYERVHSGPSLKLAGRLMAGQCLEREGRRQDALKWYAMIVDERGFAEEQAAMRMASELLQRPMTENEKELLAAWGAFDTGMDDQAKLLFDGLFESPDTRGDDRAEAAYGLARIHHEAGRSDEAIDGYRAVLDLPADPLEKWHGFARMHLVSLYLEQDNVEDAQAMLDQIEKMSEPYDFRASVENQTRVMQIDR